MLRQSLLRCSFLKLKLRAVHNDQKDPKHELNYFKLNKIFPLDFADVKVNQNTNRAKSQFNKFQIALA